MMRFHSFLIFSFVFPFSFFLASCGGGGTAPPEDVTDLGISTYGGQASLSWTEPTTPEFNGVMIRRALGAAPPVDRYDGDLVAILPLGTATLLDSATAAGNQYAYRVLSVRLDGAMSAGVTDSLVIQMSGSTDNSFGVGAGSPGVVEFGNMGGTGSNENVIGLVVDAEGRLVVSGWFQDLALNTYGYLSRYTSSGVLDITFNASGPAPGLVALSSPNNDFRFHSLGLDGQGRILVAGLEMNVSGFFDALVARFNTDGTLDTTFNAAGARPGFAISSLGNAASGDYGWGVKADAAGKIIVVALNNNVAGESILWRLNADGTDDLSFGSGAGFVRYSGAGTVVSARHLDFDSSGNLFLGGAGNPVGGFIGAVILKFLPDGTPDPAWDNEGTAGMVTLRSGGNDAINGLFVDGSDRVVVSGYASLNNTIWRLNADGTLDNTFGAEGVTFATDGLRTGQNSVLISGSTVSQFSSLIHDKHGNYTSMGTVTVGGVTNVLTCRFTPDGLPDATMGGDPNMAGCAILPQLITAIYSAAQDANGRLLYAGRVFNGLNDDGVLGAVLP